MDIRLHLLTLSRIFVGRIIFTNQSSSAPIAPLINPLDHTAKSFATFVICLSSFRLSSPLILTSISSLIQLCTTFCKILYAYVIPTSYNNARSKQVPPVNNLNVRANFTSPESKPLVDYTWALFILFCLVSSVVPGLSSSKYCSLLKVNCPTFFNFFAKVIKAISAHSRIW